MEKQVITPHTFIEDAFYLETASALTTVQSKTELAKFLSMYADPALGVLYSAIFLADPNGTGFNNFLYGEPGCKSGYPFRQIVGANELNANATDICKTDEITLDEEIGWLNDNHAATPGYIHVFPLQTVATGFWVCVVKENVLSIPCRQKVIFVSSQLQQTVSKFMLEDTLIAREEETDMLQSLNTDFTSIRERRSLLNAIHQKLKALFDFGHQWVAVVNDDQLTITSFLLESRSGAKEHPRYQEIIRSRQPINDNFFNKVLLSKDTNVFDLQQIAKRQTLPEYMQVLHENGVNKIAMTGLHVGARTIGIWAICLVRDQMLTERQLGLIRGISSQLSIAVENIIVNEQIKSKEIERELLLNLSFDISNVRTRDDLVRVINNNVRKLFAFENICVFLLNDDPAYNSYILASPVPTNLQPPGPEVITDPAEAERIRKGFDMVLNSDGILALDLDIIAAGNTCSPYLKYEHTFGIKEKIAVPLQDDERILGMLCVNNKEKGTYSEASLELIKGVSYQISTAVSNILANEDILRNEQEREQLLSISTAIAAVRSSDELLQVINRKFKSLLAFSHTVIGIINEDKVTVTPFLRDPESNSKSHKSYQDAVSSIYDIDDGVLDIAFASSKPIVLDLDELSQKMELPLYLKINYESGVKQAIISRFYKGDNVYGFLMFFYPNETSFGKNKLHLIESLANQVSVAVLNIIANDNIKNREKEKSRLLAFSNAIVSVRDKVKLAKVLKQQLKDLLDIDEYVIHMLNADKTKHTPILFDPDAEFPKHPDFKKMLGVETDIHDGIFDVILSSEEPVFFRIDDWTKLPNEPTYANAANAEGLKTMVGTAIKYGSENIAVMNFKHNDPGHIRQNCNLFKSLLSQIAIMISNIIANDQLSRQFAEINSYKLLLEEEKTYLKEEIEIVHNYAEIIGESAGMQKVFRLMAQVAHSDSTVLLLGETGTGKELVARAIHNNSPRKNKLMVKVNCAALPVNLIESELFGHERGSFTGATERRLGKFELANGGTLFLDEIGEMPVDLQVKLLRALQEREIERIGGKGVIKVDVRIIAATNRELEKEIEEGRFRMDLYYRLNIFPITLPPLRERKEDIPVLASHFIGRFGKKAGRHIKTIGTRALQDMMVYNWPGNIRELEHQIERSILLSEGDMLKQVHLPAHKSAAVKTEARTFQLRTIDDNERQHIIDTLNYCQGRVGGYGGAAEMLGVPASTLFSKMKKLGIRREVMTENLSK